jgi:hypothetical protein
MVCGECGNLGCGAVSTVIESSGDTMTWRDFGYENTYEPLVHLERFVDFGPLTFNVAAYRDTLTHALKLLGRSK